MSQLPPGFVLDSQKPAAGPVYGAPQRPSNPPEPKTTFRTLTPDEVSSRGLNPGHSYQISSEGKIDDLGAGSAPTEDNRKSAIQNANLDSVVAQINRVQGLYDRNLRDEALPILSALSEYLPTETNKQFDAASAGLAEQAFAAFRVPGVGAQSDTELRQFVDANKPSASTFDAANEEKLRQLRARVDATRAALNLPPAQWTGGPGAGQAGRETTSVGAMPSSGGPDAPPLPNTPSGGTPTPPVFSPGDPQMAPATGFREEDDPALKGVRDGYAQLLARSAAPGEVLDWLRSQGVSDSDVLRTAAQQAAYRRKNPSVPLDRYNFESVDDRRVPLSGFEEAMTTLGGNALGAYVMNAGQTLSGNALDNLAGDPERVRAALDISSRQNPLAAAIGQISGGMMSAGLGEIGLARAGVTNALARGVLADVGVGAATGAGAADNGGRLNNALAGAAYSGAGNLTGNALAKGIRGVSSPAVRAMQDARVPMTVGQVYSQSGKMGAAIKGIEDRVEGLPILGEVVKSRRREGIERFNERAFSRALEPIGGQVKGKVGEEAVTEAHDQVSAAFNRALAGKAAIPDKPFQGRFNAALNQAAQLPRVGSEVLDGIVEVLRPYDAQPALTGEMMQQISRELQALKVAYRSDPLAHRINKAINATDDAILGMFDRQFAGMIPEYAAAREAYRKVSIVQDAVLAAKNSEGVFTPAQLGNADKRNTIKYAGRNAAASGKGPFHDYQRAAQTVLPSRVPDSGTAGRLILPGAAAALVGGDAAMGDGVSPTTLTIGAIVAGAYSKAGQRLLTKGARGVKSDSLLRRPVAQRLITSGSASTARVIGTQ